MSSVAAKTQMSSMLDSVRGLFAGRSSITKDKKMSQHGAVAAAAFLLAVLPFETEHLFTMLAGAMVYLLVHVMQPTTQRRPKSVQAKKLWDEPPARFPVSRRPKQHRPAPASPINSSSGSDAASDCSSPSNNKPEVRTTSVVPVQAPTFHGSSWDDDVKELVSQITPSAKCHEALAKLAAITQRHLDALFPGGVEVQSYASGNTEGGKAFGVAVPDFELVAKIPAECRKNLNRCSNPKNLLRACTERLVQKSGFKFRRSAFKGDEPKVTLLAPTTMGVCDVPIPLNFSVDAATPGNSAMLLNKCGKIDTRASSLILLVRRWAKDRGISHAAKGHLSSHEWSLLAIFFLQVGLPEGPVLPALEELDTTTAPLSASTKSVGQLLQDFFRFYTASMDWQSEAVMVRSGCRGRQLAAKLVHRVERVDGSGHDIAPSIEDPFDSSRNLSAGMCGLSCRRFKEELQRATECVDRGASLAELLELWAPPDAAEAAEAA